MTNEDLTTPRNVVLYRSGAAARAAGIQVETLRVWERRYAVVSPRLSARGQRLYSAEEIRRLSLIKRLVDHGHAIGAIAALPMEALAVAQSEVLISATPEHAGGHIPPNLRVALVGPSLSGSRFNEGLTRHAMQIVAHCIDVEAAARALRGIRADITIIALATLEDASVDAIERIRNLCGARHAIVLYRFAPTALIGRLRNAGHQVARAPFDAAEVAALCSDLLRMPSSRAIEITTSPGAVTISPPRFDEQALSELANASTSVYCECPHHLVELLVSLSSFERYSAECANRSPGDAALHRDLEQTAARARMMLEDALLRVARAEGLPIPGPK